MAVKIEKIGIKTVATRQSVVKGDGKPPDPGGDLRPFTTPFTELWVRALRDLQ